MEKRKFLSECSDSDASTKDVCGSPLPTSEKKRKIEFKSLYQSSLQIVLGRVLDNISKNEDATPLKALIKVGDNKVKCSSTERALRMVQTPMDLTLITEKVHQGMYFDLWDFIQDVHLIFENIMESHSACKTSKRYKSTVRFAAVFQVQIDQLMKSVGYCCGEPFKFNPSVIKCIGKENCNIHRNAVYYSHEKGYHYCNACFKSIRSSEIDITGEDGDRRAVPKKNFVETKNNHVEPEQFVYCCWCKIRFHKICVLYMESIFPRGFMCDRCVVIRGEARSENKFIITALPNTHLGSFIECRVNRFLNLTEAGYVSIRVASDIEGSSEVLPRMMRKFVENGRLANSFPYRCKTIFAFEKIDDVDVCFFSMQVHEYGSNCPPPNSRRVYIAYVDSVYFFNPRHLRSKVYHEIILGYLEYAKCQGYTMAHIWACPPPSPGDDYILNCHPKEQKVPRITRLLHWYKTMLDQAKKYGIIENYQNILNYTQDNKISCPSEIPYLDGDCWPNLMEGFLKELEETNKVDPVTGSPCSNPRLARGRPKKSKQKLPATVHTLLQDGDSFSIKVHDGIIQHSNVWFCVRLQSPSTTTALPEIRDPDRIFGADCKVGNRDEFLAMCRMQSFEFSSLRRAKYTTMGMVFELIHNQNCLPRHSCPYETTGQAELVYCDHCYQKGGYTHPIEKEASDLCTKSISESPVKIVKLDIITESESLVKEDTFVSFTETVCENSNDEDKVDCATYSASASSTVECMKSSTDDSKMPELTSIQQNVDEYLHRVKHSAKCRKAVQCEAEWCKRMSELVSHILQCVLETCELCASFKWLNVFHKSYCKNDDCSVFLCKMRFQKQGECQLVVLPKEDKDISINSAADDAERVLRRQSIDRACESLSHASKCQSVDCEFPSCKKMRAAIHHVKHCTMKSRCPRTCRQYVLIIYHHAKHCQEERCMFMHCSETKQKLRHLRFKQLKHEFMTLRKDVALGNSSEAIAEELKNSENEVKFQKCEFLDDSFSPPSPQLSANDQGVSSVNANGQNAGVATKLEDQENSQDKLFAQEGKLCNDSPYSLQPLVNIQAAGPMKMTENVKDPDDVIDKPDQSFIIMKYILKLMRNPANPEALKQVIHILKTNPDVKKKFMEYQRGRMILRIKEMKKADEVLVIPPA